MNTVRTSKRQKPLKKMNKQKSKQKSTPTELRNTTEEINIGLDEVSWKINQWNLPRQSSNNMNFKRSR